MEDIKAAKAFCFKLYRRMSRTKFAVRVEVRVDPLYCERFAKDGKWAYRHKAQIVFTGGSQGEHSIDLYASDEARIQAHFEGYCQNNGVFAPRQGQRIAFPSGSAACLYRVGRVERVGAKRALVAYTFNSGRKAAPKWVPFSDILWGVLV